MLTDYETRDEIQSAILSGYDALRLSVPIIYYQHTRHYGCLVDIVTSEFKLKSYMLKVQSGYSYEDYADIGRSLKYLELHATHGNKDLEQFEFTNNSNIKSISELIDFMNSKFDYKWDDWNNEGWGDRLIGNINKSRYIIRQENPTVQKSSEHGIFLLVNKFGILYNENPKTDEPFVWGNCETRPLKFPNKEK